MKVAILLGCLFFFMAIRMPVVFSLLLSSIIYFTFLSDVQLVVIAHRMLYSMQSFPLLALPLYIFAADILTSGELSSVLFNFTRALIGHVRGSLGYVNVIISMIFAGMSGSMSADIAGLGKIELPMMKKAGYDDDFSIGITGASSIIGPIIPPSIQMVIYGMIAEQSVGRLFVGGFIPGLIMGVYLMILVLYYSRKRNYPKDPQRAPWKEMLHWSKRAFWALITPAIILSGIVLGVFTPTEAAVVAVVWAFFISRFIYKAITVKDLVPMLLNAVMTTAIIMLITGAAAVFGWIITTENVPGLLRELLLGITDQRWVILMVLNIVLLILGCFFDITAIVLVFTPVILPVLKAFQIDLVHWGVVQTLNVCIGFVTPPFGIGLFLLADMTGRPVMEVARNIFPFLLPLAAALLTITYLPELVLFLPRLVFG